MNRQRNSIAERVARCAALVKAKPRTEKELCSLLEVTDNEQGRCTVRKYLKALQDEGFVKPIGERRWNARDARTAAVLWGWCE